MALRNMHHWGEILYPSTLKQFTFVALRMVIAKFIFKRRVIDWTRVVL